MEETNYNQAEKYTGKEPNTVVLNTDEIGYREILVTSPEGVVYTLSEDCKQAIESVGKPQEKQTETQQGINPDFVLKLIATATGKVENLKL